MNKLVNLKLPDYEIDKYIEFLNPESIYVPVPINSNIQIHKNDFIKKDTILFTNELNEPIYSSVSGLVVDVEKKKNKYNTTLPTLKIINNFKEEKKKTPSLKDLLSLSKEDFINNLKKIGIKMHDENESSLYKEFCKEIKCLAIKCFDDEPMCQNSLYIIQNNLENILHTIDNIREIFAINNIVMLIKNSNATLISKCQEVLSGFPKIQIKYINNLYPTTEKPLLTKELFQISDPKDIDKIVYLSIVNIFDIYNALKRKQVQAEKYLTIIDTTIKKSIIVKVKIGTKLSDVINHYRKLDNNEMVYLNNILKKEHITTLEDYIVSYSTNTIYITKEMNLPEKECINCGMCYKICPKRINPLDIDFKECLKCGLCSFYCPSNINLVKRSDEKNEK